MTRCLSRYSSTAGSCERACAPPTAAAAAAAALMLSVRARPHWRARMAAAVCFLFPSRVCLPPRPLGALRLCLSVLRCDSAPTRPLLFARRARCARYAAAPQRPLCPSLRRCASTPSLSFAAPQRRCASTPSSSYAPQRPLFLTCDHVTRRCASDVASHTSGAHSHRVHRVHHAPIAATLTPPRPHWAAGRGHIRARGARKKGL